MVVIAVGGFAYISYQQQSLSALRTEANQLRDAVGTLTRADAAAEHVLAGDPDAMAGYFREIGMLNAARPDTLDTLPDLRRSSTGWSATGATPPRQASPGAQATADSCLPRAMPR